jgi:hypothetical protein
MRYDGNIAENQNASHYTLLTKININFFRSGIFGFYSRQKYPTIKFYKVMTMVYSTYSYCVFGLFISSGELGSRNTTFRKPDLFPSSGEGGEDTYSVGPLRKSD